MAPGELHTLRRMVDPREALHRPIAVNDHTVIGPDGVVRIRDTGLLAADISNELGVRGRSNAEVLAQHPELDAADLEAVKAHDHAPIAFDVLLGRVLGDDPTHDDVLAAYLFLPRIVLSHHEHPNMGTPMHVRSSFEAAFSDAANVDPSFIKAIGELVFLDQVGTALDRTDRPAAAPTSMERALERFADLNERERAALYALRNALAHDFSLVNQRPGSDPRSVALRHSFRLDLDGDGPLVTLPDTPWDGDLNNVGDYNATHVNLNRLTELAAEVRACIDECYDNGSLKLARSPVETRRRYIFVHGASGDEFDQQLQADDNARWRLA
jgi:uncharacterized protein (DUF433 family)